MHERHLKVPNPGPFDSNRERHLKHPASSVKTLSQYRQTEYLRKPKQPLTWFQKLKNIFVRNYEKL
jgi:hypothetical protein